MWVYLQAILPSSGQQGQHEETPMYDLLQEVRIGGFLQETHAEQQTQSFIKSTLNMRLSKVSLTSSKFHIFTVAPVGGTEHSLI